MDADANTYDWRRAIVSIAMFVGFHPFVSERNGVGWGVFGNCESANCPATTPMVKVDRVTAETKELKVDFFVGMDEYPTRMLGMIAYKGVVLQSKRVDRLRIGTIVDSVDVDVFV